MIPIEIFEKTVKAAKEFGEARNLEVRIRTNNQYALFLDVIEDGYYKDYVIYFDDNIVRNMDDSIAVV